METEIDIQSLAMDVRVACWPDAATWAERQDLIDRTKQVLAGGPPDNPVRVAAADAATGAARQILDDCPAVCRDEADRRRLAKYIGYVAADNSGWVADHSTVLARRLARHWTEPYTKE